MSAVSQQYKAQIELKQSKVIKQVVVVENGDSGNTMKEISLTGETT